MSNFSSVLIIFHQFFTWISLGDKDFCFSPMLVRTANAFEEENKWVTWLYHQCSNHFIHTTDGVTVTSLPASLLQKINEPTDHLCQVTLNQKCLHKFEKWCKSSSCVKAKSHIGNCIKWDLPVITAVDFQWLTYVPLKYFRQSMIWMALVQTKPICIIPCSSSIFLQNKENNQCHGH